MEIYRRMVVMEMNIGNKIKNARLAKGYTQEELGKLIGVQKSAVAKYEKGRVVNIKRSVLAKISKVLEIPPVELVSDIEERPVDAANKLADMFLGLEIKEEEDIDLNQMIKEYKQLDETKKVQAREFIHFLLGKL